MLSLSPASDRTGTPLGLSGLHDAPAEAVQQGGNPFGFVGLRVVVGAPRLRVQFKGVHEQIDESLFATT